MAGRSFPIVYALDVKRTTEFYERLGFVQHFRLPPDGPAGYVGLRTDQAEMAVVSADWPKDQYGIPRGDGPVFEIFIYVDDADKVVAGLAAKGVVVIREPEAMPWGERVGFVRDPDGNPVAIATARR
jgi:lactoylglutathione lyase